MLPICSKFCKEGLTEWVGFVKKGVKLYTQLTTHSRQLIAHRKSPISHSRQHPADSRRQTAHSRQQTEDRRQKTADRRQYLPLCLSHDILIRFGIHYCGHLILLRVVRV
jgi:hypothetical protein